MIKAVVVCVSSDKRKEMQYIFKALTDHVSYISGFSLLTAGYFKFPSVCYHCLRNSHVNTFHIVIVKGLSGIYTCRENHSLNVQYIPDYNALTYKVM